MDFPVIDPVATENNINRIRKDAGLSVASMAEHFGFASTNAIYKWLNGESMPTLDNAIALSHILNTSLSSLIILK